MKSKYLDYFSVCFFTFGIERLLFPKWFSKYQVNVVLIVVCIILGAVFSYLSHITE